MTVLRSLLLKRPALAIPLIRRLPALPLGRGFTLMPTKYGLGYLGMILALLVGSINHNSNLGYLLTFSLAGILVISLGQSYKNLQGMEVRGGKPPPVFAGQALQFPLYFRSPTLERFAITAEVDRQHRCQVEQVPAAALVGSTLSLPTVKRGLLRVKHIELGSTFPLGLVQLRARRQIDLSGLVYPRPIPVSQGITAGEAAADTARQPITGGLDFSGLHNYQPGDSPRRIHWRSLAAGRGLYSIRFEEAGRGETLFALAQMPGHDLETKLSQLCHLVVAAETQGLRYGLDLGGQRTVVGAGKAHLQDCLKALALY
jgi:uncharacterized protein (DUF58 family)